jgi:DNA-binding transcriptional ArsR family regulator
MTVPLADSVLPILARSPSSAAELGAALEVSQPTLSRALRLLEQSGRVVRLLGTTRGARYGLARQVGTAGSAWPLYRIDTEGTPEQIATLRAIERDHYYAQGGPERIQGLFQGIPYYLQDARPAGFLGRAIPAAHPELALPARVVDWTDAHMLTYVTQRGSESVGDLIVGTEALNRYLSDAHGAQIVHTDERATVYPALAQAAMFGAPPGSSAQGEHPKFSIRLAHAQSLTHVLVKFSPPRTTAMGVRWADLLIAEHLACELLSEHGIAAAHSEIVQFADQVFLQSERFDRVGAEGRRGVISLYSLDLARYGTLDNWSLAAQRLLNEQLISAQDAQRITLLDTLGALIANSDRHFGNITLFDRYEGSFELAPVYDMLPMLFAPQSEQLIERSFEPAGPTAVTLSVWPQAQEMAQQYWTRLSEEPRLSADFRARSVRCLDALQALPRRGAQRTR